MPLTLKMYLFRNGLLSKNKPFFDSEELEIKLSQRNQSNEFFLTLKNKSKQ